MKEFEKRGIKLNVSLDLFNKNRINVMFEMVPDSDKKSTTTEVAAKELTRQLLLFMQKIHEEKLERGYINVVELK